MGQFKRSRKRGQQHEQRWVSEVWAWGQRDRMGGAAREREAGKGPALGAWLALTPE